eukprot:PhF_6_TR40515/c1_g1_i2/m.60657
MNVNFWPTRNSLKKSPKKRPKYRLKPSQQTNQLKCTPQPNNHNNKKKLQLLQQSMKVSNLPPRTTRRKPKHTTRKSKPMDHAGTNLSTVTVSSSPSSQLGS